MQRPIFILTNFLWYKNIPIETSIQVVFVKQIIFVKKMRDF